MIEDKKHGQPSRSSMPIYFVSDLFYIKCIVMVKLVYFNFL